MCSPLTSSDLHAMSIWVAPASSPTPRQHLASPGVGDKICGGVYVGRVQSFIAHKEPGTQEEVRILDAKWFAEPSMMESWNAELECPVVVKKYKAPAIEGDYWLLQDVPPIKLILAPHLHKNNFWQVLHVHSDFMSRF